MNTLRRIVVKLLMAALVIAALFGGIVAGYTYRALVDDPQSGFFEDGSWRIGQFDGCLPGGICQDK